MNTDKNKINERKQIDISLIPSRKREKKGLALTMIV